MRMERKVVPMQIKYLDRVLEIERLCFKDPWPRTAFLAELEHPWSWFRIVGPKDKGGRIRRLEGFTICWMLPGDLHILNLAIAPECRRLGLAGLLLDNVMNGFARRGGGLVNLEVRESNRAAQRLYLSFDFQVVGRRPNYYRRDHEDAIVMTRMIDNLGAQNG